jgi:hypothetical protein
LKSEWDIVTHLWSQHRAALTAHKEVLAILRGLDDSVLVGKCVHIGLLEDLPDRQRLILDGLIDLHNVDPIYDAFEAFLDRDQIFLMGNTPRGLLQAVYAFEEQLALSAQITPQWHDRGVFRMKQRLFHPRFDAWPGERADIGYISRLGASHCLISHDWQGSLRHFQGYVTSPIFPRAVPAEEVAQNCAGLRQVIESCKDYDLGCALWITELPCQGGPWVPEPRRQAWLERFPAEVLSDSGTYQGKVLCFGHAQVQAFYRDVMKRFFDMFPEIETIFLFGMDSGGEGCDPEQCPRCKGLSKFEQRDRLIRFLIEEGGRLRPHLRVLTSGWHWEKFPQEFLARQAQLPAESGVYMAAECDGWQVERQSHHFLREVRKVCRERGQLFIGYDNFHLGDDATHLWGLDIQDFPLGIGAKMARWHDLGVDGVFDHWGTYNELIPTNSVACREFFMNPLSDPEVVGQKLAINQYGEGAGKQVFLAWQALERAHRILSNCVTWCPNQWPGWYAGKGQAPLPEFLLTQSQKLMASRLVPKEVIGFVYNEGTLADCLVTVGKGWQGAVPHFEMACKYLDRALADVDDAPVGYSFWWKGKAPSPSRREHLERHKMYVACMLVMGREIGLHFALHGCFEQVGQDAETYLTEAQDLLQDDLGACRDVVAFIDQLLLDYLDANKLPIAKWRSEYMQKIEQLEAWYTGV